jgi:hypothetical protein
MKTSELTGAALDWAVAKCEAIPNTHLVKKPGKICVYGEVGDLCIDFPYQPSTDWSQGGPIIGFKIDYIERDGDVFQAAIYGVNGHFDLLSGVGFSAVGETILIAAMRCYVASTLGDEVELPTGL